MWKMILNLIIDFLLFLMKEERIKEKEKIEQISLAPVMEIPNANIPMAVEEGTVKPLIIEKFLPKSQYCQEITTKTFICLHHTAGYSADSTIAYWMGNKERVATNYILDRDGTIYHTVPNERWAFHLYVGRPNNRIPRSYRKLGSEYDKQSIGIEIASVGQVTLKDGIFYDIYKRAVHPDKVVKIPTYKGFSYWEQYTDAQIKSLEWLLLDLMDKHPVIKQKVKLREDYSDMCNISQNALDMKDAIVGHNSLVTAKYDVTCQPNLVNMLNNLKNKL